jgi:F-type H+-transporting ATPase subunit b
VLTAVVTVSGDSLVSVRLVDPATRPPADEEGVEDVVAEADAAIEEDLATEEEDTEPSPIEYEYKELAWGAGAFIVLALVMRYFIFPRLREGMNARYEHIQQGFTDADALRESAKGEVAAYEQALGVVKAEAAARVDAARQALDAERAERLATVNAGIAERKAAAAADAEAARQAAAGNVREAAGSVAARVVELGTGTRPDTDAVQQALLDTEGVTS